MDLKAAETDVLAVDAGPTGMVMASELAARSIGCRIIDKTPVRSERSRPLVVHARSLELLQKMGVADELVVRGQRTIKAAPFVEGPRAVRADGYVVFRTPDPSLRLVRAYLQRMFPSSSYVPAGASRS